MGLEWINYAGDKQELYVMAMSWCLGICDCEPASCPQPSDHKVMSLSVVRRWQCNGTISTARKHSLAANLEKRLERVQRRSK